MKVLQIGVGKWGMNHFKVWKKFLEMGLITDIYLRDPNVNFLKYEDKHIHINHGGYSAIIDDIDYVDIVTPPSTHVDIALKIIDLKKNIKIFIEKPVALSVGDFDRLHFASQNIMAGHIFRYHEGVDQVRKMLNTNAIGDVEMIYMNRLATREFDEDSDILMELMIHDLDILSYWGLLNDPMTMRGTFSESTGVVHMMDSYGVEALIVGSWQHPEKVRNIKVVGSEGTIELDLMDNRHIRYNNQLIPIAYRQPLETELHHFIDRTSKSNLIDIKNVMDTIYKIHQLRL